MIDEGGPESLGKGGDGGDGADGAFSGVVADVAEGVAGGVFVEAGRPGDVDLEVVVSCGELAGAEGGELEDGGTAESPVRDEEGTGGAEAGVGFSDGDGIDGDDC